ncbi:MAG: tRNA (adenosine(37)-N6)-threonylcarbamoyltransferase complex ATPase subunit type 1 TsaE [Chthoniobacterales bacterium]
MDTFISNSVEDTIAAGRALGSSARAGDVVALLGDLGAGKTHFVKGVVAGVRSDVVVTSPTFTLVHEYEGGTLPVYHFDFFRLISPDAVLRLGLDEYLDGAGISLIEWADRFPEVLPRRTRWIRFGIRSGPQREISEELRR